MNKNVSEIIGGMNIDGSKVLEILTNKIGMLEHENAVLKIHLETLAMKYHELSQEEKGDQ